MQCLASLALQLADAAGDPLELSLSLLPALHRGDDQIAVHLLAHDQVGGIDVVHLLADALQAVFQPQDCLQVALCHPVHLVDGLTLGLWHNLGVTVDVEDLLDLDLQSLRRAEKRKYGLGNGAVSIRIFLIIP